MAEIPRINWEGFCGTGAPGFLGYTTLADDSGNAITTVDYTIQGKIVDWEDNLVTTFVIADTTIDGEPALQYEIQDTTAITPGIYRHQTIITNLSDFTQQVAILGEIAFRGVL